MSKITFVVETKLPLSSDIHVTQVTVDHEADTMRDMLEQRLELVREEVIPGARKNVASRQVNYEAFGSDSDYANLLDKLGAQIEIVSVKEALPEGGKPMRIVFDAQYSDGSPYNQDAWGANLEDATFQGAWDMAVLNNHTGEPEEIEDLLDFMESIEVLINSPKPVNEEDMAELLADLVLASASGDGVDEVVDRARQMLETMAGNDFDGPLQEIAASALARIEGSSAAPKP
jgi:hypothetical protein